MCFLSVPPCYDLLQIRRVPLIHRLTDWYRTCTAYFLRHNQSSRPLIHPYVTGYHTGAPNGFTVESIEPKGNLLATR